MNNLLATVTLECTTGVAKDAVVNTFCIDTGGEAASGAQQTAIADALQGFYNNNNAAGTPVAWYLNKSRSRAAGGMVIRLYDITGKEQRVRGVNAKGQPVWKTPAIGSPISLFSRQLGAEGPSNLALPNEVAIVLSLRTALRDMVQTEVPDADADGAVDRPKARHTGRIFIGPLNSGCLGQDATGDKRVDANCRAAFTQSAQALKTAINAIAPAGAFDWCVWSRANGTTLDVDKVVVDDAFDTMRKRGVKASATTLLQLV